MFSFIKPAWLAAISILVTGTASTALAQGESDDAHAAPGHVVTPSPDRAPTPATGSYESAFDGYRRFGDEALRPWREANDTVGAIGGWKAYAREAQSEDAAAPSSPHDPGGAHGNHGSHGGSGPR